MDQVDGEGVVSGEVPQRGPWDWLWRGRALAAARALRDGAAPLGEPGHLQRAEIALELGDRARDPIDPLRAGAALPLCLSLYRQATYWALLALGARPESSRALDSAFDSVSAELLLAAAGSSPALVEVRAECVERNFVDDARAQPQRLAQQAAVLRRFIQALLLRADPARAVERLLWQRRTRIGALLLVSAAALLFALATGRLFQAPDLAQGRAWRTSSTLMQCHPETSQCGGSVTKIFFHTAEEKGPWIEFDLGAPQRFAVIEVENRRDCCADRAVPLVLEVSQDRVHFHQVARRNELFLSWRAQFEPVTARFVRARVARKSSLHLERLAVRVR